MPSSSTLTACPGLCFEKTVPSDQEKVSRGRRQNHFSIRKSDNVVVATRAARRGATSHMTRAIPQERAVPDWGWERGAPSACEPACAAAALPTGLFLGQSNPARPTGRPSTALVPPEKETPGHLARRDQESRPGSTKARSAHVPSTTDSNLCCSKISSNAIRQAQAGGAGRPGGLKRGQG